jgi:hypothetical protein
MPLDPHLRDTLEQFRGMLRRLTVSARSANFERMVYLLDLALVELAAIGEPRPGAAAERAAGDAGEARSGSEADDRASSAGGEQDEPPAAEPWAEIMHPAPAGEGTATTRH